MAVEVNRITIAQAASGKFEAFRPIVDLIGPDAFRLARYLSRNEGSLDVCLDWLVALHENLSFYDRKLGPKVWIVRELLQQGSDYCQRRSERLRDSPGRTRRHRLDDELLRKVEALPRTYRFAFILFYGLDWPIEATAVALQASPERCRSVLLRARYFVTHQLRHFFLKPSSGSIPTYRRENLPSPCQELLGHLTSSLDTDPGQTLPAELAEHLGDCPRCQVEAELYHRIPLRPATAVAPAPEVLWAALTRHRAMLRAHEVLESSQAGLLEEMMRHRDAPPPHNRILSVLVALALLALLACAAWYALTQAGA